MCHTEPPNPPPPGILCLSSRTTTSQKPNCRSPPSVNDTPHKPLHSDNSTNPSAPTTTQNACPMSQAKTQLLDIIITDCSHSYPHQSNNKPLVTCPPSNAATGHHCSKWQPSLDVPGHLWHPFALETIMLTNKPTTEPSISSSAEHLTHHPALLDSDAPKSMHDCEGTTIYHEPSSCALIYHALIIII